MVHRLQVDTSLRTKFPKDTFLYKVIVTTHRSIKKRMEFKTNLTHKNEQFRRNDQQQQAIAVRRQTLSNQTTILF